ncbi:GMC family oxidoreductase [Streptomyces fragilis]|uniref:GMC family oxidoreductase n=1 Tax=Streptomyces fragilis TaxID=67301 RepID=A0ABV2YJ75_9ACTN|nr:GMC oxidoreductase [Streptomyces fragilis]
MPRSTCRLSGECDVGCNYGSKNTLDHTYLSAAAHHGADLRTRCEVRGFAPLPDEGYEVRYVVHEEEAEGRRTPTDRLPVHRIACRRLVLAAGTFGTTYLLLRNRAALPGVSGALGTRFCGNGDLLGLLLHATDADGAPRSLRSSTGPVITSAVRVGDTLDEHDGPAGDGAEPAGPARRGFYVEDAGYPAFVDWLAEAAQMPGTTRRMLAFAAHRLRARLGRSPRSNIGRQLSTLLGPAEFSDASLPLLGMGRDVPDGRMSLRNGYLDVDWTTATSLRYFERLRSVMSDLSTELGAEFRDNPLWWSHRVITVHPLGGAPMGRHPGEGVCDSFGEVFGFPGLYVLDGSALPGPVGANPSLTIAAFADRACDRLLDRETAAPRRADGRPPPPAEPRDGDGTAQPDGTGAAERPTALSFTEEMKGYAALDEQDPLRGRERGTQLGQRLAFRLTITTEDAERFVDDPAHPAVATGHVDCDALGGRLPVERGSFNLFTRGDDASARRMLYRLELRDPGGNPVTLAGHKEIRDDPGADVWKDTTTLYVRLLAGHVARQDDEGAPVVGAGVLTIRPDDFAQQMTTFRTDGPHRVRALQRFGQLFLGELWDVYAPGPAREGPR